MKKKKREILFSKAGISYIPANAKGWIILYIYVTISGIFVIVPTFLFDGGIALYSYQIFMFLILYIWGLRFANKRSE